MTQHTGDNEPVIRSEAAFFDTFGDPDNADDIAYLRDNELGVTTITGGTGSISDNINDADATVTTFDASTVAQAKRLLTVHTISSWCALVLGLTACMLVFFTPRSSHLPDVLTWIVGAGFLIMLIITATTSALRTRNLHALGIAPE